jgi:NAD(P)-dependent dehydrogenase (short-subunit alcohol dehydrogenase family)
MRIEGATALVTGARRGIGLAFAQALLDQGAATVYAGVRDPSTSTVADARLIPLALDVTDPDQVTAAAERVGDASILINNSGVQSDVGLFDGDLDGARREMEVNYLGTWSVSRAFAPVLARNGGGALVNMLSVASWRARVPAVGYAASKSAEWALTNALRTGLRDQGTLVVGVHAGYVDTEFVTNIDAPKITAESVAAQTIDAILHDRPEVLADEPARSVKAALSYRVQGDPTADIPD